jgi:hypothetical protein
VRQNELGEVEPWNDKAYQDLHKIMDSIPASDSRDKALDRVRSLDCGEPNPMLASCDPSVQPPPEAAAWRKALEAASVDDDAYRSALAKILKDLVCSGSDDAIYVARGGGFRNRIFDAGAAASGLIDDLINNDSKNCRVAAALTEADRANLLWIKEEIQAPYSP